MGFSLVEKILVIDSSTRDMELYPESNDYTIHIGRTPGVYGADIIDANIPWTQDPISKRNNTLVVAVDEGTPVVCQIPPGTYTETTLVEQLQNALQPTGIQVSLANHRVTFTHPTSEFRILLNRSTLHPSLGIQSRVASIQSINKAYTPNGVIDLTGGARYIRVASNLHVQEHVADTCDPGMGVYFPGHRQSPWVRYPSRLYDRPRQINSIGIRLENPDGTVYESGTVDHVFVVRLWIARKSTSVSTNSQEFQ
jgi:hypothetical protein